MSPSSPLAERSGRGRRAARLTGAPLLALLVAGAVQDAAPGPSGEFILPTDLTDDLYHRVKAGLFVPDREPLVIRMTTLAEDGSTLLAGGHYVRLSWGQGTFDVRSDRNGLVVVHMDLEATMSHMTVSIPPFLDSMTRVFDEYPYHPIQ